MGHLTYGYRKNEQGRIEHRSFDIDSLLYGEAARNGWVDSPDKVPGAAKIQEAMAAERRATETQIAPEPKGPSEFHGEKRKGWPKGKPRK
jgi:hypothetical protein